MTTAASEPAVAGKTIEVAFEERTAHLAYHGHELVDQVRNEAVGALGLPEAPERFFVSRGDGEAVAGDLTLAEAGISPGDRLLLRLKSVAIIYNGREEPFRYRADELVGTLRAEAVTRFGITLNPHLMALFNVENVELADAQTLRAAGVKPGTVLVLRQSVVRGG